MVFDRMSLKSKTAVNRGCPWDWKSLRAGAGRGETGNWCSSHRLKRYGFHTADEIQAMGGNHPHDCRYYGWKTDQWSNRKESPRMGKLDIRFPAMQGLFRTHSGRRYAVRRIWTGDPVNWQGFITAERREKPWYREVFRVPSYWLLPCQAILPIFHRSAVPHIILQKQA